jgi:hypothetical protein
MAEFPDLGPLEINKEGLSQAEVERQTREAIEERLEGFGTVTSHFPGRTRFRLNAKYRNPEFIAERKARLESQPGVREVTVNPRTGSVLILYDKTVFKGRTVLEALVDVEQIGAAVLELPGVNLQAEDAGDERSQSERVADAIYDLTVSIYERTGLRFSGYAVPAAIGGLGALQIATYGIALETLSGPFLLYIAWDIFTKLRAEPPLPGGETVKPAAPPVTSEAAAAAGA